MTLHHDLRRRDALLRLCTFVAVAGLVLGGAWGGTADAQERATFEVRITKDLEIPTRSGNVLRGDLYQPVADGEVVASAPTVVTYFPYVKDDDTRFEVTGMQAFARAGYAGLLVDIAGTGVSPGDFGFLSEREIDDGHDVVEWAAEQPFSNGRVGMWGYSYPGLTAAHVAARRPPHLEAVVPASIFHDAYRDLIFPGGIMTTQDGAALLPFIAAQTIVRQRPGTDPQLAFESALDSITSPSGLATLAEGPTHTTYDEYWRERALEDKIADLEVPALFWGGWSDIYPRGTLLNLRDAGTAHRRLVMGPWGHLAGASGEPLELFLEESLAWFDTFLRQEATPEAAEAAAGGARIFDIDWTGDDVYAGTWPGRFVELETWPAATEQTTFALCAGSGAPEPSAPWPIQGALAPACEQPGTLPVVHVPVDATGGGSIGHDAFADPNANLLWDDKDQRLSLTSTALLTEPLERDVVLTGPMQVTLTASTTGVDTDWVVRVVDVGPDQTRVIAPGWLRASRRHRDTSRPYLWHTHDRTDEVVPGEPYELEIEVWPSSYRIPRGHRLGLLVRTADSLKVAPGVAGVTSTIHTGPDTRSVLTVPSRTAPDDTANAGVDDPASGAPDDSGVDPAPPSGPSAAAAAPTDPTAAPAPSGTGTLPSTGGGPALLVVALAAAASRRRPTRP